MEPKKPWQSKTLWINLIVAILAMAWPQGAAYIGANPEIVMSVMAGLNIILRLISKDKISLD